jgi:DNA-binding protein YbaB
MLDNFLGDASKMQEEIAKKLSSIFVEDSLDGVTLKMNGLKEVVQLDISESLLTSEGKEQLEDLMIILFNRNLKKVTELEQKESAEAMKKMLPPGFDNLFG